MTGRGRSARSASALAGVLALLHAAAACTRQGTDEEWRYPETVSIAGFAEDTTTDGLSERAVCFVTALREAGDEGADCMAGCIRSRAGVNIGGGCWHRCYAYQRPMPDSSVYAHCPKAAEPAPGPAPRVECRAGTPGVRGRIVDAEIRRPVPIVPAELVPLGHDRFSLLGEERYLALADADGRFSIDVEPGLYVTYFGRMGYRMAAIDTLDLRSATCEIEVSLVPVDPDELEGF